jgi:hypothetical protein
MQQVVQAIFKGQGGSPTVSAAFGIIWYLWTQWQSHRATVAPQVVTQDGRKAELPRGSSAARQVDALAAAVQSLARSGAAYAKIDSKRPGRAGGGGPGQLRCRVKSSPLRQPEY